MLPEIIVAASRVAASEPMSNVDTAWLRMERPTNLMMITAVWMLGGRLPLGRLKRVIASRFLAYRRFRQKPVDSGTTTVWQTDAKFDIDWHVRRATLPGKGDKAALQDFVSEMASTPLDHARPLWQFHVADYDGGSALITRIHHCYADGLALMQVVLSMTDEAPAPKRAALAHAWRPPEHGSVFERLLQPARAGLGKALEFSGAALQKGGELLRDPAQVAAMAKEGAGMARELAAVVSTSEDPPTALKRALSGTKHCAWADPLPLDEVKAIGKMLGCTINDILVTCAAGALRGYLRSIGDDVDGLTIRALVPVNLRPVKDAKKLGNYFGLVFLDLPIGEVNPLRRLERVAASMRELKRSPQPIVTFGLLAVVGMAPVAVQQFAFDFFSSKATVVVTNVPGPQIPLYFAGCEVREMMFWVPQSGSVGVGLSILSYNGRVHFGVIADAKLAPDPEQLARRFATEMEKLTLIALMEDWEREIGAPDAEATLRHWA